MIVVKIQGGLGNQMFQYALGRKIQKDLGQKMLLDISDYKYDKLRKYSLDCFCINNQVTVDDTGKFNRIYDRRKNFILKLGFKFFPEITYKYYAHKGYYIWDFVGYKPLLIQEDKDIFLNGYWQSERYFKDISEIIVKEFKVKYPIGNNNKNILEKIKNSNSVCVHIRRGDFLNSSNKLAICSNDYFLNAMKIMNERVPNVVFYIFSDDIEDVRKNFRFGKFNCVFMENHDKDYDELQMMYSCKHFIIPNSTFSWWAQYLSESKEKVVIAPSVWYIDGRQNELMLENWITLKP